MSKKQKPAALARRPAPRNLSSDQRDGSEIAISTTVGKSISLRTVEPKLTAYTVGANLIVLEARYGAVRP
jgi:hypothetical protein